MTGYFSERLVHPFFENSVKHPHCEAVGNTAPRSIKVSISYVESHKIQIKNHQEPPHET